MQNLRQIVAYVSYDIQDTHTNPLRLYYIMLIHAIVSSIFLKYYSIIVRV